MIDLIVKKLKTGTIKNVVPFGYPTPAAPYVVVREEPGDRALTLYRITVHRAPAEILLLRSYVKKELPELLEDGRIEGTGTDTRSCELRRSPGGPSACRATSDDGTISQEQVYYLPDMTVLGV